MSEAAEQARIVAEKIPQFRPNAFELFRRAKRFDLAAVLAEEAIKTAREDLPLHKSLVEYYARTDRWEDAHALVEGLGAATREECLFRIDVAIALSDWLEKRGRIKVGARADYLQKFMDQTRAKAAEGNVEDDDLDALESWVASPQTWLVAGPFPGNRGIDHPLPPEDSIDPAATYDGAASSTIRWRVERVWAGEPIDLKRLYPVSETVVAYATSYIHSDMDQSVTLQFGGRDFVKVWLEGDVILKKRLGTAPDEVPVKLKKGSNRLLIKTIDHPVVDWSFSVRTLDDKDWPASVKWSTEPDL